MSRADELMLPAARTLSTSARATGPIAPSGWRLCGMAWSGLAKASRALVYVDFIPSGSKTRVRMRAGQSAPAALPEASPAVVNGTFAYSQVERNDVDGFAFP